MTYTIGGSDGASPVTLAQVLDSVVIVEGQPVWREDDQPLTVGDVVADGEPANRGEDLEHALVAAIGDATLLDLTMRLKAQALLLELQDRLREVG